MQTRATNSTPSSPKKSTTQITKQTSNTCYPEQSQTPSASIFFNSPIPTSKQTSYRQETSEFEGFGSQIRLRMQSSDQTLPNQQPLNWCPESSISSTDSHYSSLFSNNELISGSQLSGSDQEPQSLKHKIQAEIMKTLPVHLKRSTLFTNATVPPIQTILFEDQKCYNFLQNQLSSPQPKQHIVLDINISQIANTVIVDSTAQLEEMKKQVNNQQFILIQNYNHIMRTYKPVCSIQAVQIKETLYLIDCQRLGMCQLFIEDRSVIKITSDATPTGTSFTKVIEVLCPITQETFKGVDFRSRPISKDIVNQLKNDFLRIKEEFQNNHYQIREKCYQRVEQFNNATALGRLLKIRDELAKQYDEGCQFIMEDAVVNLLASQLQSQASEQELIKLVFQHYAQDQYLPFYIQRHADKFVNGINQSKALPPKSIGLPPKPGNISFSCRKPPIASRPLQFSPGPLQFQKFNQEELSDQNLQCEDVFQLIPRAYDMDPEERANYFTQIDKLEPEQIIETQVACEKGIPSSLAEIFEISNANRRQNKKRKKQQATQSSGTFSQTFFQLCTHQYSYEMGLKQSQETASQIRSVSDLDFLKQMGWVQSNYQPVEAQKTVAAAVVKTGYQNSSFDQSVGSQSTHYSNQSYSNKGYQVGQSKRPSPQTYHAKSSYGNPNRSSQVSGGKQLVFVKKSTV